MGKRLTLKKSRRIPPSNDMNAFHELLGNSRHILALTGAGLSAASGIPTFRGVGGLWRNHDALNLATPEGFDENPSLVWQFYHYRREKALLCRPNAAHTALSLLSIPSVRHTIAPESSFHHITQNVDGLCPLSLSAVSALHSTTSPPDVTDNLPVLLEMHGRLFDVICTECPHVEFNKSSPICPALAGTENHIADANTPDVAPEIIIDKKDLPRCSKCGALTRPGVVWFGEVPKYLDEIDKLVASADLCLVVGTSSTVYPAAEYAARVQSHGGKVAVFNLERSNGDGGTDFLFLGPCEETLPEALGLTSAISAIQSKL
ncbi:NAD-dependent protein deacylase [Hypsizygus marmoreus]|uniref:NAD-dependent protein deacylase n=1 Tax=Hypsizygus marmoreus TaxID=39966 RepID=A0A369KH15_HYPMA|nr:NAD-dependent protein deacylase [Hypsizygus marmoreus]